MREFVRIAENCYQWNNPKCVIRVRPPAISFCDYNPNEDEVQATREEFITAAMQAVEKMREAGIDIGTDWLPKWEPKEGEVCYFWDDDSHIGFSVGVYSGSGSRKFPYCLGNLASYQNCAPFDGTIPEPFKSRWEAEKP